jgi:glycosyltransferase involved in cell wall biosynthesis
VLHAQGHDACSAVVAAARSVIVSSDDAAQVIRQYTSAPILVLPLGHPQRASTSPQFGHVVALGRVDDGKHPEVLVDLAAADPRLNITAIGRLSDEDRQRCMERAHELGCAQRIRFTGAISDAERDAVLATAWVGVQLRSGHPGQMSASITELLARAIPVVTTMTTHGADAAGLRVISAPDAVAVIDAIDPWWSAQRWAVASQWAADTAASHTANEVARRLATWLDEVDRLPSGVYR